MPNSVFIVVAAVMIIIAMMSIVLPLVRRGDPSPVAAGAIVAVMPLSAALLYFAYSNWQWDLTAQATQQYAAQQQAHTEQTGSLQEMVEILKGKLEADPDNAEGWQMLGRSYVALSQYADAMAAYDKARQLSGDNDVHAITGYAESLAMVRGGAMDEEIGGLFEKALALAPDDRKGLWYGGIAAFDLGRPGLAKSRWQSLLALDPPEQMAALLHEQIAAADAALGNAPAETTVPVVADEVTVAGLRLNVSIAAELTGRAHPDAPVFILAKQVGAPGPPLAVVRKRVADLPLEILLSDADAMVAGNVISAHDNVEVVARIALNGTPTAQTGDFSGSKVVASSGNVAIVIDSIVGN